jgi:hypothetical protein
MNVVEIAIALNLIYDIIERIQRQYGVTLTPDNIREYVEAREALRKEVNAKLGV